MIERKIEFVPAYDERYGMPKQQINARGVAINMSIAGELGAVQFKLRTNWYLPHIEKEIRDGKYEPVSTYAQPSLIYYSPTPMLDGQAPSESECELVDFAVCYSGYNNSAANLLFVVLIEDGDDGVWRELEGYYTHIFGELR